MNNQAVLDAQRGFGNHIEGMPGEQIEVLVNASGQGVFDGNDGKLRLAPGDGPENIIENKTRNGLDSIPEDFANRMMTESPRFTLECDL
jgi:hypothetical protein